MLRVYARNHSHTRFACQYYRLDIPLDEFSKRGLAKTWNDKLDEGYDAAMQGMINTDFSLWWGHEGQVTLDQFKIFRDMKPALDAEGQLKIPPVVIFDVDDNRDYIHPHNTVFCTEGVRAYPAMQLLKPGERVCSRDEATGKEIPLWIDKETHYGGSVFDIARNLERMRIGHQIKRTVHGMTTTSPHLAKYLKDVVGVEHVHVFPNTIVPSHYQSLELVPKKGVRILWQGGSSHLVDWWPLRNAMKQVCASNPDVKIVMFGQLEDWVLEYIPREQIEYHPWVDYAAYKLKRGLLQIDINLAPLANNPFNRCKSAIKWYEASIWDKPEATLASRVPPFSDEMTDNKNGLLFSTPEEFVFKLQLLIDKAPLRECLAQEAKRWVRMNRHPDQTIPPLWEYYCGLREVEFGKALMALGASGSEMRKLTREFNRSMR